jgi:microcystin-dependent protein
MTAPFLGQIEIFAFGFAPKGWLQCNGQTLAINQYQALFSLIGTYYGGNGVQTFQLPNLQSRVPISMGPTNVIGQIGGSENVTLLSNNMPLHTHLVNANSTAGAAATNLPGANAILGNGTNAITPKSGTTKYNMNMYTTAVANATLAPQSVGNSGGNVPHTNIQPYLALNICIAISGIFPSRN